jgi:hypothetical protein
MRPGWPYTAATKSGVSPFCGGGRKGGGAAKEGRWQVAGM